MVPFLPHTVQEGDMGVATDASGDHYCIFVKRLHQAWEIISVSKQKTLTLSDQQFGVLVQSANFRLAQHGQAPHGHPGSHQAG